MGNSGNKVGRPNGVTVTKAVKREGGVGGLWGVLISPDRETNTLRRPWSRS